jgi:hypothetical protein
MGGGAQGTRDVTNAPSTLARMSPNVMNAGHVIGMFNQSSVVRLPVGSCPLDVRKKPARNRKNSGLGPGGLVPLVPGVNNCIPKNIST